MIINAEHRQSTSYLGTIEMDSAEDQTIVKSIRRMVKEANRFAGTKMYVKIQGRGHRQGVRRYNQSLPLPLATTGDLYLYTR